MEQKDIVIGKRYVLKKDAIPDQPAYNGAIVLVAGLDDYGDDDFVGVCAHTPDGHLVRFPNGRIVYWVYANDLLPYKEYWRPPFADEL